MFDEGMFIDGLGKSKDIAQKSIEGRHLGPSIGGQTVPSSEQRTAGEGQWDWGCVLALPLIPILKKGTIFCSSFKVYLNKKTQDT